MNASRICTAVLIISAMLFQGCVHDPYSVDVIDATDSRYGKVRLRHIVKKGDTLYGIAFKYGTTVKEIARLNGIRTPYTIFPNQTLWVYSQSQVKPKPKPVPKKQPPKPAPVKKRAEPIKPVAKAPAPPRSPAPVIKPPLKVAVPVKKTPAKTPAPVAAPPKAQPKKVPPKARPTYPVSNSGSGWLHPSNAKRGKTFTLGKSAHKGVDYHGKYGSPVTASRGGVVVYAGDGLKAYGLLVIIKHDNNYLSAYAYNKRILVNEGETVNQGQTIAEMGKKVDTVTLHFEIRRDGKPVNPLSLLPK